MLKGKKAIALIQARASSTRLPMKQFRYIGHKRVIDWIVDRLLSIEEFDKIIISTSYKKTDSIFVNYADEKGIDVFRYKGDINDVVGRHYYAAKKYDADYITVISGDCPLIDKQFIKKQLYKISQGYEYIRPAGKEWFHEGVDTYSWGCFEFLNNEIKSKYTRENFGINLRKNPDLAKIGLVDIKDVFSKKLCRISVDNMADLRFMNALYRELDEKDKKFNLLNVVELLKDKPGLLNINNHVEQKQKDDKTYRFVIKTEASQKIGLGHIKRMMVLGKYLNENKNNGVFYLINNDLLAKDILEKEGYIYDYKIASSQEELIKEVNFYNADILIIDVQNLENMKYHFEKIKKNTSLKKIILVDKYIESDNVGLFIMQGIQSDKILNNVKNNEKVISGLKTVFVSQKLKKIEESKEKLKNKIVISFGGTDIYNVTTTVLKVLKEIKIDKDYKFSIILGPYFNHHKKLNKELELFPYDYEIINSPQSIISIIKEAKLGIVYYGVTFYEFKYLGIPTIDVIPGKEYCDEFNKLEMLGLGHSVGVHNNINKNSFNKYINNIDNLKSPNYSIGDLEYVYSKMISEIEGD